MTLLVLATQVTTLLTVGLVTSMMLRRRAAALRHLVLFWALLATVAVPAATPIFPLSLTGVSNGATEPTVRDATLLDDGPSANVSPVEPPLASAAVVPGPRPRWWLGVWLVGTLVLLLRLAREAVVLARLSRHAPVVEVGPWARAMTEHRRRARSRFRVSLLLGADGVPIMSWGLRRPRIIVPSLALQWGDDQVMSVLCHEFAHIDRRDWLRFAVMELVRALYWWHPLAWIAIREARLHAECACDDMVLRQQVPPTHYAEQLVALARLTALPRSSVVTATAYTSFLERRIAAMLTPAIDRSPVGLITRCLGLAPLLVMSLLVTSAFARPQAETGTLVGTVRPDGGQPLPAVEVVLSSAGQADVRVRTDASGSFAVDLPPGSYRAAVRVPGFKRYESPVDVVAGERVARDFALRLGAVTASVFVAGGTDPKAVPMELAPAPMVSQVGVVSIPRRVDEQKAPAYPSSLRDAGIQGLVKVAGRIGPDGYVSDVQVLESPHDGLSQVVRQYVSTMRYEPTKVQGLPMSTDLVLTIDFRAKP